MPKRNQAEERASIALKVFMAMLGTAGREERKPEPETPARPEVVSVDRWIAGKWVTKRYAWDGSMYSIDVTDQYHADGGRIW